MLIFPVNYDMLLNEYHIQNLPSRCFMLEYFALKTHFALGQCSFIPKQKEWRKRKSREETTRYNIMCFASIFPLLSKQAPFHFFANPMGPENKLLIMKSGLVSP